MKNNFYTQMQMDVMNTANNIVIQQMCAEKGIEYNQMLMQAQQEHLNKILMAEQQRQMEKIVKRHYQSNSGSFFAKMRDAFTEETPSLVMPMTGLPTMGVPMQPMVNQPTQIEAQMFVSEIPLKSETEARIDALENKMDEVTNMLSEITNLLKK